MVIYQSSLKLEQNPALVYQETRQCGDADHFGEKKIILESKGFRYITNLIKDAKLFKNKNLVGKPEFTSGEATTPEAKFDLRFEF